MPTVLVVQGWRIFFYSNEGDEPMHVHAVKGDAECKYWLYPDRFDIALEFEYNSTPRLRREIRQIIFEHSIRSVPLGGSTLERAMPIRTTPVLAKAIETTPEALIVKTETGSVSIPWAKCSERLAHASFLERSRAELSPSGYGIHWPLLDEDLAVGPLLRLCE